MLTATGTVNRVDIFWGALFVFFAPRVWLLVKAGRLIKVQQNGTYVVVIKESCPGCQMQRTTTTREP